MYSVTIRRTFSAAHTITIGGVEETLHGHNFAVEITLASKELDTEGVVADFRVVKRRADDILKALDHTYLNDLEYFKTRPPTAENLARHIYEGMAQALSGERATLARVTVWESETARASYGRGDCG